MGCDCELASDLEPEHTRDALKAPYSAPSGTAPKKICHQDCRKFTTAGTAAPPKGGDLTTARIVSLRRTYLDTLSRSSAKNPFHLQR